ncbi:MAG: hypothetical protein M3285_01745 [Actinomycetota bacterium]|nr:hypothetical protein [Actinomycetota bacterium]
MRARKPRRFAVTLLVALLTIPVAGMGDSALPAGERARRTFSDGLSARTLEKALQAKGRVVRRTGEATVEALDLGKLSGAGPQAQELWRVRISGDFPPRALRYEVEAGDELIGFGLPAADQRSLVTVTTSPAVLSAPIEVTYGGIEVSELRVEEGSFPSRGERIRAAQAEGPYEVTRTTYNLGEQVFQPSELGRKVELIANVHYPTGLPDGPYPLVVFMHGNHSTCFKEKRTSFRWPCPDGWRPLPNFRGYDYIGSRLASYGFVVVSVSANGINVAGGRLDDTGMRQRGEVIDRHLELWRRWSTIGGGPFGNTFVGKIDLTRIGTMGHSRGGEGVVWHKIVDDERADPFGVDAVLALAPVDFTRVTINRVGFAVILPYCDGDVSDLQGVHFFDDSRYEVPGDPTPKHSLTVMGANHNFFNTVWTPRGKYPGGSDDGRWSECEERLTPIQERQVGRAYIVSFFRLYLTDTEVLEGYWTGGRSWDFLAPAELLMSYLAPDTPEHRMDLGRMTRPRDLFTTHEGTAVTPSRVAKYEWCKSTSNLPCIPGRGGWADIHRPGLSQGVVGWDDRNSSIRFNLPETRQDVTGFDAFQFRTVVNPGYDLNFGIDFQDLAVELVDGAGNRAEVIASDIGNEALEYPLKGRRRSGHVILNQLRFPLKRFDGVDMTDVSAVIVKFSRTRRGVINFADVVFSRGPN